MDNISSVVLSGTIIISPHVLGGILGESCFYIFYDPKDFSAEFCHNDNSGGKTIMRIQNVSHETIQKLAIGMGVKPDYKGDHCRSWSKTAFIIDLYHDRSEEAESIKIEAFKLGITCKVHRIKAHNGGVVICHWSLRHGMYLYEPPPLGQ